MNGHLSHLRVLDLTDERGLLTGHMLAQLGADVVQLEGAAGSPARRVGPFANGDSLFWAAYSAGKRSVQCDFESDTGREILHSLVAATDILVVSASPSELEAAKLDYARLQKINPNLIYVSVTAFGMSGPKAGYADSDLVVWAAGGYLLLSRDEDGSPLRFSVPQAYLHAAADAAAGALLAYFARQRTGRGQSVDVSAQQSTALTTLATSLAAQIGHADFSVPGTGATPSRRKQLDLSGSGSRTRKSKWRLRDGYAEMHLGIGPAAGRFANNLIAWLAEENAVDGDIAQWDWVSLPDRLMDGEVSDADLERARTQVAAFLGNFSKSQLIDLAIQRKLLMAPVMTTGDLAGSPHHTARGFFQLVLDAEGRSILLPGDYAPSTSNGFVPLTPAPEAGAHSAEVLSQWTAHRPTPEAASPNTSPAEQPLDGLKVLDLAWVVAGPIVGRALADFGATVVRVESSRRVETARVMGPFPGGKVDPEKSALYETCNAGKLGLTLDLSVEEGRAVLRDLVGWADVVVESFSPGQMARWGLDFETLRTINPSLIMLSTSLMGQTGPYARYAGFGNLGAAVSGYQAIVGKPGSAPVGPFGPYTDFIGPRFGLVALLAALDHRRRTGKGGWLDVSQAEAGIQFLAPFIADYSLSGRIVALQGNRDLEYAPNGVFPCRLTGDQHESWVAITVRADAEWRVLARLIGGGALAEDRRFTSLDGRKKHEDALEALVGDWTIRQSALDVEESLQSQGIPAHRLVSSQDMAEDVHLAERQYFVHLAHDRMGESVVENARYLLSDTPARILRSAPYFGRDNQFVLGELLGYDEVRMAELDSAGILE